jgi:hypothetical protein
MSLWKIIAAGTVLLAGGCSREVPQDKGVTIMLDDPVPAPPEVEAAHLAAADETPPLAGSRQTASASPGFSPEIWALPGAPQQASAEVAHP